jgi:hypothetical protein
MKEYIQLYCSGSDTYLPLDKKWDNNSLSSLFSLLFGDFRPWDNDFLYHDINLYNAHFIYHDLENKILYMGFGDWLIDEEIDNPSWEELPEYLKKIKNCVMSVDNYLEFRKKWVALKEDSVPFAIIYRDDHDWVDCKGFNSQEEMELFVKNYQIKEIH